ncbi:dihydroxyacetone kinase subunit DhaL [Methylobacillus flagellatus]|uniref:Dihydroxyacetone kinase DhaL subunit n=1 Tax=Methylobacillus flagellatus (strain ATCC 51484 / DSM 6875 / VKM B-1610 / KT) TaxID=265072 RepID=Q1H2B4_METFK|nr:dihydroxyacetone kinase subunit DhaL [Methylobacillus flagellatus]ABE49229.1 dihydroxyacetone kinase DhaL subunit [Methylobacillus flagellatus KT]ABE49373.1 dihydroxyacetone kinase DhaL subunit [Methylobacillus flagellatus KT]
MRTAFILEAIAAVNDAVLNSEAELESLDREIGDGDHFINLKRGCAALLAMRDELAPLPPADVLQRIGMKLLSTIGGASGPLIATFFMTMAKVEKAGDLNSLAEIAAAFHASVEAIKQRGKADAGEKTLLDTLIPVADTFSRLTAVNAEPAQVFDAIQQAAEQGMLSTKDMVATKGRAAFLGERAIGHIDPGARSSQIIIHTIAELAKQQAV